MVEPSPILASPHLHPTHLLIPKETHVADVDHDVYTGLKTINSYEVLSEIGRGEHGKVKLGRDLFTGTNVAVKIVPRFSNKRRLGRLGAPEDRVKKEVAILKKARHPNVVSLLEVIDDPKKKKVYIVLEYIEHGEIRWRTKGAREINVINNRRLQFEREGRPETAETLEQDMVILRRAKVHQQRDLRRARSVGQNPVSHWSLEYGAEEDEDNSTPHIPHVASVTSQNSRDDSSYFRDDDRGHLSSTFSSDHSAIYGNSPRAKSVDNTSLLSHQSSDHWADEDDDASYVPTLSMTEARSAFRDTLLGLQFLHFQGIIHRDIKPANLLMSGDDHVKISDFGVSYLGKPVGDDEHDTLNDNEREAQEMDDPRLLAKTVGTPAFYAPELIYWDTDIFEGGNAPTITGAIDMWALGVTLYCMIYGRLPFFADAECGYMEKILKQEVFVPRQRLKPVRPDSGPRSNSVEVLPRALDESRRADDELIYEEVPENVRDLIRLLLVKDPLHRISIENAKIHPWVVEGIDDPTRWNSETDPRRRGGQKIQVSGEDVSHAVVKKNVLERTIDSFKVLAGELRSRTRTRATSAAVSASASAESIVSHSGSSGSTVGKDKDSKSQHHASHRGDEITTALKASRETEHHPLAQSQTASPSEKEKGSYFDDSTVGVNPETSRESSLSDNQRPSRPRALDWGLPALSTTDSSRTVRAPQPQPGRSALLDPPELQSPGLLESTAATVGNMFSGVGKRLSVMRSRERRPIDSSRSPSTDDRSPDTSGRAEPSLALSNATASGNVTTPEALRDDNHPLDESSAYSSSSSLGRPRNEFFKPESSPTTAFERAQEINHRRRIQDADREAERTSKGLGPVSAPYCPPSPDDEVFHDRIIHHLHHTTLPQNALSNQPSVSTIASSSIADNGGISQSTSHPSIPESGASSIFPEEMSPSRSGLHPTFSEKREEPMSLMSTGETITPHGQPAFGAAGGFHDNKYHTPPPQSANQGWSAQDEDEEMSSDDEGLTFGKVRRKSSTKNPKAPPIPFAPTSPAPHAAALDGVGDHQQGVRTG